MDFSKNMNIRIRLLHTAQHQDIADIYFQGQKEVLKEFGVDKIDSIKNNWRDNPLTYMLIAENIKTGEIGGGLRLDVVDPSNPIPIQEAIKHLTPSIVPRVHKYDNVLAELCGMWVKKEFSERSLSTALIRSAISVCSKLRISVLLALPPLHTKFIFDNLGFSVVTDVSNKGEFQYPDERYISTLMALDFTEEYSMKNEEEGFIKLLKEKPNTVIYDQVKNNPFTLEYDLRLI